MKLTKLKLTKDASNRLRFLAGKTGLTPNLLCRLGFCLSLSEAAPVNPEDYPEEDREFNRYTLLGEYDLLFISLLRQRCLREGADALELSDYFRAHMNRGVVLLQNRIRSVGDLASLVKATPGPTSEQSF
jgi:DNA sulfur modification protein DndE